MMGITRKRLTNLTVNTKSSWITKESKEKDEDLGEPLSPAGRLFHQPHLNCYIIVMLGSSKTIDVDAVKAQMKITMLRHPRFCSVLVSGKAGSRSWRWVKTKVSIDDHVVIPKLQSSSKTPDELVEDYVSSLSATTLPFSRPLWDLHLINLSTSKSQAVGILRMHHSLGDGVSLMSLLLACSRKVSDPDSLPNLPPCQPRSAVESFPKGGRLWTILVWMLVVIAYIRNTLVDMVKFVVTCTWLKDSETPMKAVEGVEFHQKRFVHTTLSLDDFKLIKNSFDCTINDVLLGMTSAGLSRYLNRRYSNISNVAGNEKCHPRNIRLRTALIVNIRPGPAIHEVAEMLNGCRNISWGNWIGYVIVPIPIMKCEDPLTYLRKAIKIADRKRRSLEGIFTFICCCLSVKILGTKIASFLSDRLLRHTTVSLSNIMGPCDEVGYCGHSLVYLAPSVYGHPQATTLHFQSYMNKMEMVLAVDELTIPDPHQLLADLTDSLKGIRDAVIACKVI